MDFAALAGQLRAEANRTNQRRLVVLAGDRDRGYERAGTILETVTGDATLLGPVDRFDCEQLSLRAADELLGTTRETVVLDLHDDCPPNVLGQTIGAVDGGGLAVLLVPALDQWPTQRGAFDEGLAVPPFSIADVGTAFRQRLVATLRRHRGIAIVDVDEPAIVEDGLVDPAPALEAAADSWSPQQQVFSKAAYEHCRTADQAAAVQSLEVLRQPDQAVVVEADRGRGKSSALGIAAGSLAAEGLSILVTAPAYRNARELFERARELLDELGLLVGDRSGALRQLDATGGGQIQFAEPDRAAGLAGDGTWMAGSSADPAEGQDADRPDILLVDEAAALPVRTLDTLLEADRVAFATTTYGYEGAGRGFSVRFRDHLAEQRHDLTEIRLDEPIRYAAGDPVETWLFDALLLDARPVVDPAIEDVTVRETSYVAHDATSLRADEHRLRELFGLLVLAHYRTEPNDLARLLDAPNIAVRTLEADGHVVAVALLAREGGLPPELRASMFDGDRINGNMLPDVLTSQLRDEAAAIPVGARVLRIATHPAVRSRGLGTKLLSQLRTEAEAGIEEWDNAPQFEQAMPPDPDGDRAESTPTATDGLDWLGVGYGATPELLRFWDRAGYDTVHVATTRNETSGEYSVLMLRPLSAAGRALHERTTRRFIRRIGGVCAGPLSDADPAMLRGVLAATATAAAPDPELTEWEWTVVASAAYGPGLTDVAPESFRRVVLRHLVDPADPDALDAEDERLLVCKTLQAHEWSRVYRECGFDAPAPCMRSFGAACQPLVDAYGSDRAHEIRDRYREESTPNP